ncbi:hypothetical protein AUR64_14640 [Haloprofundus marisrubri]|uniref:CHAT domain-containing protein n=1 Tax=Haloprofundus marisrubri TaxID=1514971 RepID=A0A0W1R6I8_9EURY|nr:hypothetical protein [Haloprofundus marisrubri]KTG09037.1 hypothetical protein AUR64_14640 [Haloprofundus marisrubri]
MTMRFGCSDDDGIEVVDPIERHRYELGTPSAVTPNSIDIDEFRFPVDAAVSFRTSSLTLPTVVPIYVRDTDGTMLAHVTPSDSLSLPDGEYAIELCTPIKMYLRVSSELTVDRTNQSLDFGEETTVLLGARSHHEHPAGTITVTDSVEDAMRAVSLFGSAVKTTSPERSYPTLRGHPPTVELGDSFEAPEDIVAPETGIRIELPRERSYVYAAAPLAYYLGARVEPGSVPRLVTDSGFEHRLDTPDGVERELEHVLRHVFFFDCLCRTEGLYQVDLHERRAVESTVDIDFERLYGLPSDERLEAYLSVPYETLEPHQPEWKLVSHVAPSAQSAELLPFLVDDLAIVRTPTQTKTTAAPQIQVDAVQEFLRDGDEFTRSTASQPSSMEFVEPESADAVEQAWVGEGTPVGANKATIEAYRNRLSRTMADDDIDIVVVCNDTQMSEERDDIDQVYGSREELPFDVQIHRSLTTDELTEVLREETEFLHYIGHIDQGGFECTDGRLDARELDDVRVDAFLLNGCTSYEQGLSLIEAGAIGGIVTLSDVINSGAVRIGSTLARLLNGGFPLSVALETARGESIVGSQYVVVGDGGLAITQAESGTPLLCVVEEHENKGQYSIQIRGYPTDRSGMGGLIVPYVSNNEEYTLNSNSQLSFEVSKSELAEFLQLEGMPVRLRHELRWSDEIPLYEL